MYEFWLPPGIKGLRVEKLEFLYENRIIFSVSFRNACCSRQRYVSHQKISSICIFQYRKILLLKITKCIPPLFFSTIKFATTTRSRLSVLSLWTDNIIRWLSLFWVIDVRSQSLILRKFETDLSLTAFVAGITSKIFKRMITWEKYSQEFTENVFSVSIMSLIECSSLEKLTFSDSSWVVMLLCLNRVHILLKHF